MQKRKDKIEKNEFDTDATEHADMKLQYAKCVEIQESRCLQMNGNVSKASIGIDTVDAVLELLTECPQSLQAKVPSGVKNQGRISKSLNLASGIRGPLKITHLS